MIILFLGGIFMRPAMANPAPPPAALSSAPMDAPASDGSASRCCRFHTAGLEMSAIRFLRDFADEESVRIRTRLALSPHGEPIEVYITGRLDNFGIGEKPKRSPLPWVAGVANPKLRSIALHLSHFTAAELKTTLSHELAHIYVWERSGGHRMPRWYEEGLAMWLAQESTLRHLRTVVENYPTDALPRLSDIAKSFPRESLAAHRAYATSYAFLRWSLENVGEKNAPQRILRLVALDIPFARAFETVMGGSPGNLEARWRATLTKGIWIPLVIHLTDLLWIFCALLVVIGGWRVWGRPKESDPSDKDELEEEFLDGVENALTKEELQTFVRLAPADTMPDSHSESDTDTDTDAPPDTDPMPKFIH